MSDLKNPLLLIVEERELATILAALRFHQDENLQARGDIPDQAIKEIATNSGSLKPLDFDEIDRLCERLNFSTEPGDWRTCAHRWRDMQGPETGVDMENWYSCCLCGATKYRCERQDGSSSEEIIPPGEVPVKVPVNQAGLIIVPPPAEQGEEFLWRVIYSIDVVAADVKKAAEQTHQIMLDPDSQPPVFEIMDFQGNLTTVDLSGSDGHDESNATQS